MACIGQRAAVRLREFAIGLRVAGDSAIGDRRWFIALRIAALPQSLIRERKSHLILGLCRIANLTAGARHFRSNPKCLAVYCRKKTETESRKPFDMDTIWASKRCYPRHAQPRSLQRPDGRPSCGSELDFSGFIKEESLSVPQSEPYSVERQRHSHTDTIGVSNDHCAAK